MDSRDVVMTEEMRKRLRTCLAIPVKAEFPYVPRIYRATTLDKSTGELQYDIPKELWPVFFLKGIDGVQATMMEDRLLGEATYDGNQVKTSIHSGKIRVRICKLGILGWKNFRDIQGNLIPRPELDSDGTVTEDSLKIISASLMVELANAITEQSRLTEDELLGLEL